MDMAEYLKLTASVLAEDGNTVTNVLLPGGPSVVGYQKQFRLRWMATMLHVFTVVVSVPLATPEILHDVNVEAIAYAKRTKGRLRGLQTGVAVLPVVVAGRATAEGIEAAARRPPKDFAAITMPALVDLSTGRITRYDGRLVWGSIYTSWLRARLALLPLPSSPPTPQTVP